MMTSNQQLSRFILMEACKIVEQGDSKWVLFEERLFLRIGKCSSRKTRTGLILSDTIIASCMHARVSKGGGTAQLSRRVRGNRSLCATKSEGQGGRTVVKTEKMKGKSAFQTKGGA